jgi:hypothetical protein
MAWYRIVLQCDGVPTNAGAEVARDILVAFSRRHWHRRAVCDWDGKLLALTVENDFDHDGLATRDEFSDEVAACVSGGFDGDIRIVSATEIADEGLKERP